MRILYAIQATGNGHLSRAREIIPHLLNYGQLDLLVSGRQADVHLPYLIKYKKAGISYTFGKKGGINMIDTIKHLSPVQFISDVLSFPVDDYDLVINDFEPVSAWACKVKLKPCIALSHQAAFLSQRSPRPLKRDSFAEGLFKYYAPVSQQVGFHFKSYDSFIRTPVIRQEVRRMETSNEGHVTVYLPAHADELLVNYFTQVKEVHWQIFSKHCKTPYSQDNVQVKPVLNDDFLKSLASSEGLITAGGFESPAEAMYLRKKVFAIPMLNQYEQICNAEAMKDIGVTVVKKIGSGFVSQVKSWINYGCPVNINYPDETASVIEGLFMEHSINKQLDYLTN